VNILATASFILVPLVLVAASIPMLFSKKPLFDCFVDGARDGMHSGVKLLPTLVGLMTAVAMFSASGAAQVIADLLQSPMNWLGVPSELIGLLVIRPVSGSGSTALLAETFEQYGTDSFIGSLASVIMASSDTVIYICAVYFSSAGVKKTRYALPAAFITMVFSMIFAGVVVRLFEF